MIRIENVGKLFQAHAELLNVVERELSGRIVEAAECLVVTYKAGGKVLLCGNGGSAADAQHLAGEFVGRFQLERKALPALALHADTSILTSIANDYGYEQTFARQVQAWGQEGDTLIAISTSGGAANVNHAVRLARDLGLRTIGLTGRDGGELAGLVEIPLIIPAQPTARIQEMHILIGHILCDVVERELFAE